MRNWSVEETFLLIAEYESAQLLWNKLHPLYKNLDGRSEKFDEIAAKFENCSANDVRKKIISLRCIFNERVRINKKKGRNLHTGRKPKWIFFQALEFLRDVVVTKDMPPSTLNDTREETVDFLDTIDDFIAIKNEPLHDPEILESTDNEASVNADPKKDELLEMRCERGNLPAKDCCAYNKFGNYVAMTLENLKDRELEEMCQLKIRMILSEANTEACKRQMIKLHQSSSAAASSEELPASVKRWFSVFEH